MDISGQVDNIVANLVRDIQTKLDARIEGLVNGYLDEKLASVDYDKKLNWLASAKLDNLIGGLEIDQSTVQTRLDSVADVVINNIEAEARRTATEYVKNRLYNEIDVNKVVREIVGEEISRKLATFSFPRHSIPGEAVNPSTLAISADQVKGGTLKNFNSTGIQDKSTDVQMTLLDAGVVIENKMVTLGLEVKGTTVLEGDLVLQGNVSEESQFFKSIIASSVRATKTSLDKELFENYSFVLFERIKEEGLDLTKITLNGTEIIAGNKLNYGITDTNITKLGMLKELQVQGEALINGQTFYVGRDKVGINTMEPGHALSVWDQEVELGFGKRQRDVAFLGTPRNQALLISANGKDNITLNVDGSVSVDKLNLGPVQLGSTTGTPNFDAPRGSVMFNQDPTPGSPVGWVSLGNGAWSRFSTIS